LRPARSAGWLLLAGALLGCASGAAPSASALPCASPVPAPGRLRLALPPESFGRTLSVQQQLHITASGHAVDLDAVLEITPATLTLVAMEFGQRVLTLRFANGALCEQRSAKLPAEVRGADILTDLQLALWPADAVRSSLPSGWVLAEDSARRVLTHNGREMETVTYSGPTRWEGRITLQNVAYDYALVIQSVVTAP